MTCWHFYSTETGLLDERAVVGSRRLALLNARTGEGIIPGPADHLSQRVDVSASPPEPEVDPQTGLPRQAAEWWPPLIDYVPPQPADNSMETYSWDSGAKRWGAAPTLLAVKRAAMQRMARAWEAERSSGLDIGGKRVPTDPDAWTRYLAIKAMAADAGWVDVPIPLADGESFELLTLPKAQALWAALKAHERRLLMKLRDRVEAINTASTAADVQAVGWD